MAKRKFETLYQLEEFGEFNIDFEETQRIWHYQIRLTPREYYLLNHFALSRRPKLSLNDTMLGLMKASGIFDNPVDFFGNVEYNKQPKIDKDVRFEKKPMPKTKETPTRSLFTNIQGDTK